MRQLLRILASSPDKPQIEDPREVDRVYRRMRPMVMLTATLGYAFYYPCRLGLSVVKKPLIDGGILTAEQLGWIGATFLVSYAIGKVLDGFLADHMNLRVLMPLALAMSAGLNLVLGSTTWLWLFIGLWALNAVLQGVGSPASVVVITRWFSPKQRGSMYGIWSTAHALGEGLTYFGVAAVAAATVWRAAFWFPGIVCLFASAAIYLGLRDRPEAVGLPPACPRSSPVEADVPDAEEELPTGRAQLLLLKRPAFWCLGVSAALIFITRYAVNNWGVLYLQEVHGFGLVRAGSLIGLSTVAAVGGCVAYGFISDRLFNARRPPVTLIFGIVEILSLLLIFYGPKGNTPVLAVGLILYGFTLSGLLAVIGGLFAVDIAPKKAVGAAVGLVGLFSYVGAGAQELLSGYLIGRGTTMVDGVRHYDFSIATLCWVGASVLSAILVAFLWRVKTT